MNQSLTPKEQFLAHYVAIMPQVLNISERHVNNHKAVMMKLGNVKTNLPVLEFLLKSIRSYKLKAASYLVPIDADLIKPNLLAAAKLEVTLVTMIERIK